ncbi:flagellar hook assembly protein FlgD [Pseudooceanicola sp. C21-150M6]|uniref:flagellar hook assembly protein FlgD n=1 Tax=Pseudooceanicola sp. C21-150M6 TaxID=3434355 RepID=UPI003D7FD8F8
MVTSITDTSALATTTTTTASDVAANKLATDYKSFLTLLTAQLTNQDPLEPMDSTTFVSQLAQLSQVEQSITTNSHLEAIASQLNSVGLSSDLGLIGRTVTVPSSEITLAEGAAEFEYTLAAGATSVSAVITDASGTVLREIPGLETATDEIHSFSWDGLDYEGLPVTDGTYSVEIVAVDQDGTTVDAESYVNVMVERLTFLDGLAVLHLANGDMVSSDEVQAVE